MASSLPAGPVVRVLTADENREQLRGLGELLGRLGHEVVSRAVSVSEAAAMIAAEDPDASIVRLHRDDEHALALIEELSESATGPVIAVLDEADPEFISEAAARGIHAFAQPADDDNVQAALELAVRRHADAAALSERVDQLQTALERRAIIERAKGILMERHGVDDRTAFVLLRDHARRHGARWSTWPARWTRGTRCCPRSRARRLRFACTGHHAPMIGILIAVLLALFPSRLAAKNRHNLVSIGLFLLVALVPISSRPSCSSASPRRTSYDYGRRNGASRWPAVVVPAVHRSSTSRRVERASTGFWSAGP